MAGTTPNYGLPYPQSGDLVSAYPALGQDLAEDLDTILTNKADSAGVGLVFIDDYALSGSSVVVNSCFTSSYAHYLLVVSGIASAGEIIVTFRMRSGGSSDTGNNYDFQRVELNGGFTGVTRTTSTSSIQIGILDSDAVGFTTTIYNPNLAAQTITETRSARDASGSALDLFTGRHQTASAQTGFELFLSSGTFTSGTARLYGYRNS